MGSTQTHIHEDEGSRSFQVTELGDKQTLTGLREDIVLLSWLIVLLRTREAGHIRYEWSYTGQEEEPVATTLSMDEVMTGLQSTLAETAVAISRHIATVASPQGVKMSTPLSLLLSSGSLSKTSEEAKDEVIELFSLDPARWLIIAGPAAPPNRLNIRPVWHTENILPFTVTRHIESLVDTIKLCQTNTNLSIEDCLRPTTYDLNEIWRWNHDLPPTYSFCMHEMISQRAQETSDKEAIASWDGSLTYGEIDRYSNHVAHSLRDMGVKLHDVIPVCFEKSRWTVVAVLGVMKTGATFVLMDPTLPLARLQNMREQVGASTMVASRKQYKLATSVIPDGKFFVVDEAAFTSLPDTQDPPPLPPVPSSALMYIIFTSGSTGTPKGVKLSHETYTSSAIPRAKAVGYTPNSRVLDFASYAFDVSIDSMLLTLGNGGCLCIPSDEDRLNDINSAIRRMRINYAGLTPSVARILDADVISSLEGLGLGGEAVSARDVTLWGKDTRIIIGYGPCECTIGCTVNSSAATGRDYISIGPGNGAAMWIVDPNDHEVLMPVGAVGELLVEGPIVGQGYLNDPEKTAAAFIEDPSWLVAGHSSYTGRRGRLYKTGDLGRYDPDGSGGIVFVGRKDTQVKLRGQRVELGEIESQLRARLPSDTNVIAEVIVPTGSGGQPTLVAFIAPQAVKQETDITPQELSDELRETLSKADTEIKTVLPRYMVPTAYIPVNHIPTLISGKTDRKRLRQFGTTVDLRQLDQGRQKTANRDLSELEQRLRQAWSQTLKQEAESIRLEDNFFALGGDSLTAMKLVSVCRDQGLDLTVADAFGHPTLSAMAAIVRTCELQTHTEVSPFSLISQEVESACEEAAQACEVEKSAVEDIYPCTPTQESLFTFSLKSVKVYVAQRVACIPSHIDLEIWKNAWEEVVNAIPILRTRVAQLQEPGLQQVVLREPITWRDATNLAEYLETDRVERMDLGQRLARYAIIDDSADGNRYMVWTVHHVLYDGWSEPRILQQISNVLQSQIIETQTQMRDFVKHFRDTDDAAMQEFWRRELNGAVGPQFPRLPSRDFLPTPDGMIERQIPLETAAGSPFTMATLIRGAWALVASQYSGSDDVVFGETLTGRDIPLPGVESIVGPLIATVPVRVRIHRTSSVETYLQSVQQGLLARTPYQHMGMQNIRKVSHDAQHACEAPTGLVVQPEPEYVGSELGFKTGDVVREALHFNPYPLMLAFGIRKGGFRVCASFDTSLIEISQMERILAQLETACSQLSGDVSRRISEISCLPGAELDQIWGWNQTAPLSLDESTRKLRADPGLQPGSTYPPAVVPWVCDPRNPALLSPIGCVGELWLEGVFLSGDIVDSPAWLAAGTPTFPGRSGKLQSAGDMVQLRDDGSLVFVGRKENVVGVQGHALDIADLEAHLTRKLPSTVRTAAAVAQASTKGEDAQNQELVVFVEQQPSQEGCVDILPKDLEISCESFETTILYGVSTTLIAALKKLDRFMHDSLPSYMVPSVYVVVNKLPQQLDHGLLNQLASKIPRETIAQLQQGLKDAWSKTSLQTSLSAAENILQSSWAEILKIEPEQIDVDDNFFRLGGDSVLAMKVVSFLRSQGHRLTVADIFQNMRLGDAAKVLKMGAVSMKNSQTYKAFSTVGDVNLEKFLSEIVRPQLADANWSIRDIAPVTDSQALDIRATIQPPRTSVQYTMLYFDHGIDRPKLLSACTALVRAHEVLRTVFIEHESAFFQVVVEAMDAPVIMHKAEGDLDQFVVDLCKTYIESEFQLGSSFIKIVHVEGSDGKECLVLGLSHAQYDGVSLPRLLRDLETLYAGGKIVDYEPFTSYMGYTLREPVKTKALSYWQTLLENSSLSVLDTSAQATDKSIFHTKAVDVQPLADITTANLLTAAWALVLARRLQTADVTFGSVTSGRTIDMPNVENVIGPCYQLTPVRVPFNPEWTAMDLLRFVQKQSVESAVHDFLGFQKIAKQAQWPTEFFDSIVHHQDHEDFDAMPFARGSCRVDISNPHGDAAYPIKAVSFVRGGKMHVGVVGSEKEVEFVDGILDELAEAVQTLGRRPEGLLFDN
ncbi:nonribosomal peptide synthase SidD [Aspergillus clavatus NRRL 1]|uniref:Nonribosomal peptide synthase SidD n=1 Tax=Aspergillus clavatus (strain ATCC 1007 / CBS 513.65 / DSM 816 / NCTC 3887 / NRRL 1 / QM 1276 / 107) TaxID=344612 RepID=A1CC83_ASPCL|nr:nonribosomal peptide synthase SidD [Aspergillus clavatus NRRL 1]EAW12140.1 nonribosomal peptide synthase SidD [Aspergillus clavatus NRRL 1]